MSTIDHITESHTTELPSARGLRFAIVVADWNSHITHALLEGAVETLRRQSAEEVLVMHVPGTFELVNASARLIDQGEEGNLYDAIIAIGCVVRGDTPHFDYICQGVTAGLSSLNATRSRFGYFVPVIFGVLTTNTMEQAEERAGGRLGNKGAEAAETAIRMLRPQLELPVSDPKALKEHPTRRFLWERQELRDLRATAIRAEKEAASARTAEAENEDALSVFGQGLSNKDCGR